MGKLVVGDLRWFLRLLKDEPEPDPMEERVVGIYREWCRENGITPSSEHPSSFPILRQQTHRLKLTGKQGDSRDKRQDALPDPNVDDHEHTGHDRDNEREDCPRERKGVLIPPRHK